MRVAWHVITMALGALLAVSSHAKEGDTFRPYVSYARHYDSNLFRLAESEYALVPKRSDQYGVLSAGVNMDWQPGRQRIIANASKSQVRFARNSYLDYGGSDYQLRWNWRVGNPWSGQVGATQSVTQSSFSDLSGLRINNQVTRENQFANADWQLHPRWNLGLAADAVTSTNSTVQQASQDYEDKSVAASLGYTTPKGSRLHGQLRRVEGKYPNRLANPFVERAYTQTEYNLIGDWSVSGKLVTHARVGYVVRDNDAARSGFSSLAGRLSVDYLSTAKTGLNLAVYRELSNSDDINASYQVNTGTSLGASWVATAKVRLLVGATFENRLFKNTSGLNQRDEDTLSGSLSMRYAPIPMAALDVGVQAGRRDSNVAANDYKFHGVFVNVRADF